MSSWVEVKRQLRQVPGAPELVRAVRAASRAMGGGGPVERAPGLARIVSGTVTVEVPSFRGIFELDARSHLFSRVMRTGDFEPECVRAVMPHVRPASDAIDIGANVGFYAVLLGKLVGAEGRVLAVEPTQAAFSRLVRNVERNGTQAVTHLEQTAVGDQLGTLTLDVAPGREEYSSAVMRHPSAEHLALTQETVNLCPLDDLVERYQLRPSFIKMDVEGAEAGVLRGASTTLKLYRPVILAELNPQLLQAQGDSLAAVEMLLRGHRYRLRWITDAEALCLPD